MARNHGAMGRNPFGKNQIREVKDVKAEKVETLPSVDRLSPRVADWLFIDLPAESYVIGLKTVLLTKEAIERKLGL